MGDGILTLGQSFVRTQGKGRIINGRDALEIEAEVK